MRTTSLLKCLLVCGSLVSCLRIRQDVPAPASAPASTSAPSLPPAQPSSTRNANATSSANLTNQLITSTAVVSGDTGTVVYSVTTFSNYTNLRASTTITTDINTTSTFTQASTTTTDAGFETFVAVVFAGGVAWWAASSAGSVEAINQIEPPSDEPEGGGKDDHTCKLNPKETCSNCGGSDAIGLRLSGNEIGCPCDCPQPKEYCKSDSNQENGCPCEPDPGYDPVDVNIDPDEPPLPSDSDFIQAGQDILKDIWGGDITKMPGYVAPRASPVPTPSLPAGNKTCYGPTGAPKGSLSFPRDLGSFSIDHLCGTDSPKYTSDPTHEGGWAGDRFWFDSSGILCMSTAVDGGGADGWWVGKGEKGCTDGWIRYIETSVQFSDDQTNCQPKQDWDIPKTQDSKDIFYMLLDGCDTDTSTAKNGGLLKQSTPNGCVDWRIFGVSAVQ